MRQMRDSLALVIPVHNDQVNLTRLLRQAAELRIFDQIVIVDDGSQTPVHIADSGGAADTVMLLRNAEAMGAGGARNQALDHVTTSHLLFFDSDDQLTRDLPPLWQALQAESVFDFCLFRHHDSRSAHRGVWGQMPLDNALWRQADAPGATLFTPSPDGLAQLVQTANYPWNKIYRTGFLRDHPTVRCSETPLHNDIQLHWQSFLQAKTVMASDRVAAIHEVQDGGNRMTNQSGTARLCVFEPLAAVGAALADAGQPALQHAFLTFTTGLLDWVRSVMDPVHHPAFDQASRRFWHRHLDPALFGSLRHNDPVLALRLCLQMAGGAVPEQAPAQEAMSC